MNRREELLKDIREITAQYRVEVPDGHKAWPKSIKARTEELLRLGMSATQISRDTGIAYYTVHNWKRRAGAFRALEIAAAKSAPPQLTVKALPPLFVTITMPSGLRIEGVPIEEALVFARTFK